MFSLDSFLSSPVTPQSSTVKPSEATKYSRGFSYHVGADAVLDEAGELLLVGVLVLLDQVAHVLGDVHTHDVFAVDVGVELLALHVVAGEALGATGTRRARCSLNTPQGEVTTTSAGTTISATMRLLFLTGRVFPGSSQHTRSTLGCPLAGATSGQCFKQKLCDSRSFLHPVVTIKF